MILPYSAPPASQVITHILICLIATICITSTTFFVLSFTDHLRFQYILLSYSIHYDYLIPFAFCTEQHRSALPQSNDPSWPPHRPRPKPASPSTASRWGGCTVRMPLSLAPLGKISFSILFIFRYIATSISLRFNVLSIATSVTTLLR